MRRSLPRYLSDISPFINFHSNYRLPCSYPRICSLHWHGLWLNMVWLIGHGLIRHLSAYLGLGNAGKYLSTILSSKTSKTKRIQYFHIVPSRFYYIYIYTYILEVMDRSQSSSPDFVAEMQRRRDEMKAICANVKVVYDGGAPLFTKSAIQDFSMQLERFKEGPEDCQLRLTGIDGVSVDIYVHKTKDTHWEESFSEESETKTYCINSQLSRPPYALPVLF